MGVVGEEFAPPPASDLAQRRCILKVSISKMLMMTALVSGVAMAHTGVERTTGFGEGLLHPVGGADHLLAMVAVGLWAAQMGGRAMWSFPLAFVGVMILGGIAGFAGVPVPFVEEGILVSVLILGVLIAGALRFPVVASALMVGGLAIFHGHSHGAELPASVGAGSYTIGFALATALLHLAGLGLGLLLQRMNLRPAVRFAGGAVALCGLYLAIA
jgi:urease accessory protein